MTLILYGNNLSPFVRKIRVLLIEKGVDYTLEHVNPFAPPADFGALSPLKKIPVLRDTDVPEPNAVPDSSVIADYLERKYPAPALFPTDPWTRARALWFQEYAGALFPELGLKLFFERVVKKLMRGETDEAICAKCLQEGLPPYFDYLESEIAGRAYFAGDGFSIADIAVGSALANYRHAGETLDAARWPHLAAFAVRIHARPSFALLLKEEQPLIDRSRR